MVPPLALWKKSLRHSFFHALCCGLFFNQLEGAHTVLLILSPWQRWWGLPRRSQWCRCSLSSPPSSSATSATSSPSAPSWLLSPASSSSFQVLVFTNTMAGLISAAQWVQHCVRRASFLVLFLARAAGVWTGEERECQRGVTGFLWSSSSNPSSLTAVCQSDKNCFPVKPISNGNVVSNWSGLLFH